MTTLNERIARKLLVIKAAREIKKEIEQAGLDNLKELADAGRSIIDICLKSYSTQEKAKHRRDFNALLGMGVTVDMVLNELTGQIPELAPIMEGKEGYKTTEIQKLEAFLKEG